VADVRAVPLPALTGARWVAAFLVFLHHAGLAAYLSGAPQGLLRAVGGAGHVGVSFFFVLSGFVLLWSARPGEPVGGFWLRRVARVVPLHLLTAALALILGLSVARSLAPRPETGGPTATVANALLLGSWVPGWSQAGDPVSWSLVCEAFFYAAFPLLALLTVRLGPRGARRLLALALLGAVVGTAVAVLASADLSRVPLLRLPEFVAGVACARLVRIGAWPRVSPSAALAVLAAGWVVASLLGSRAAFALPTLPGFVLLIGALGQVQAEGRPEAHLVRALSHPLVVRLGQWSFAFYLVHVLVMRVVEHTLVSHPGWSAVPGTALMAGVLGVAVAVSGALHHAVEEPANARIRRLGRLRRGAPAAAA
jgi:peptidoglycan/LPS O-acetylase OafA/YrhL